MKLSIKTTFDFGKLRNELPKILEKHTQRTARSSAEGARENISKGLSPPLKESTLEIRKHRKTGGSKPLFETGSLFRSIKGTSEGLQMNEYGLYHHRGYTTGKLTLMKFQGGSYETSASSMIPNKKVPARPFIFPSQKTILKSFDAFKKDLRKALKK